MKGVAAGLWHTICTSLEGGSLFAFGGNGFGQLGIGSFESQVKIINHLADDFLLDYLIQIHH